MALTRDEVIVEQVCGRKTRHTSRRAAKEEERRLRKQGHDVRVYGCPFAEGAAHWHVGHQPSPERLAEIAAVARRRNKR